ncbi:MOSC domain-containing protein [Marinitoga aeolica]|uniref:MOSC domain-containing protein n=1 Tax=Marinitoga aeolica TaxID=2809031 RepID=A0ABY8PTZ2_9BACT|nr:MOSC domain-containing protein [Marinitoga aeolica]
MKSYIVSLNISEKRGTRKNEVSNVILKENWGIIGDAHAGNWHRQVSMLSTKSIEKIDKEKLKTLSYGDFAANIIVKDVIIHTLPIGTKVKINDAELEITQIGKACEKDNLVRRLTGKCITPEEGVFLKVLKGGRINVGDEIIFYAEEKI